MTLTLPFNSFRTNPQPPYFCVAPKDLTFLRVYFWLNWVAEDDDEVGLKEKPEDTRYIKKITSK